MLGDGFRRIVGNVAPGNASLFEIFFIQNVRPRGRYTDKLQVLCSVDSLFVDGNFVYNEDVCILHTFRYFFGGGKGVLDNFT